LHAAWLRFAHEAELRRLAKLQMRIERKKAAMKVLLGERQRIMNRCIRRCDAAMAKTVNREP
ncbi:MAG: hypothetical protein ACI9AQ_001440, partial [Dinoroseobacter sp.]